MKLFKNIGKRLGKAWSYINGRKRNIGVAMFLVGMGLETFGVMPDNQAEYIQALGGAIGGFGWAHSLMKDKKTVDVVNKTINNAKSVIKKKQDE